MYINFQILELDVNQNKRKCRIERQSSKMRICPRKCSKMLLTVPLRYELHLISKCNGSLKPSTLLRSCCINVLFKFQALEKYNIEKDIAAYIKKEFDKKYNPTWHCIVGRNFGSYVTHETRHFIYFYLGQVAILLFKSG